VVMRTCLAAFHTEGLYAPCLFGNGRVHIARAHHHQAIHFTGVSNIAATFDFRVNAGTMPALTGESGRALASLWQ
jgi:hypothetical protein